MTTTVGSWAATGHVSSRHAPVALSALIPGKVRLPFMYCAIIGAALQIIGYALLSTITSSTSAIPHRMYGYEILAGFGGGINVITFLATVPTLNELRDHAVAIGVLNQFRSMGGALVLAIASSVFNSLVFPKLRDLGITDPANIRITDVSKSDSNSISTEFIDKARKVLVEGYNRQMILMCVCGAVQVMAALMMWQKVPLRAPDRRKAQVN